MRKIYALLFCLSLGTVSQAQLSIDVAGAANTQDFNTLVSSGNGSWTNNSTLPGFYARTTATASITSCNANNGSTITAAMYSYGSTSNSDRALGYYTTNGFTGAAGTGSNFIGWRVKNNTGGNVVSFTLTYTGEQWRKDNTSAQKLTVDYQTGATVTDLTAGTWTDVPALDFTSPVITSGTATLDGNAAANRVAGITATVTLPSALSNGSEIMIRWSDLNDSGNDHVLAIDDASITLNAAPMPITLLSFDAKKLAEKVQLNWATASELNNESFTIERSANGKEFEAIGTVAGAGISSTILKYRFTDEKPAKGINYYQLRQKDFNGESSLSKVVAVSSDSKSLEIIQVQNAGQSLKMEIISPVNAETEILVYDLAGKTIVKQNVQLTEGFNTIELATEQTVMGIHLIKLMNSETTVSKKFLF